MLRAFCLTMTLMILPMATSRAEDPTLGANAALKYWQAFAQLPKLTDAEAQKLNAEYLTMPLDAKARELVSQTDYALRMMHQGAALPRCEWAIGWEEEGIDALLPQMSAARLLSSLACVRARLRLEQGQNAEAISDVLAAMALGRQVSLDGSLIGVLVGYSIENRMGEALALFLPKLNAESIKDLRQRLTTLPQGGRPAAAMRACEAKTLDWIVRKVKATTDTESLVAFLRVVGISDAKDRDVNERARAFLQDCGGTAAGVIKVVEEARPSYAAAAKLLELPLAQFESEFEGARQKHAGNPVCKLFFPALEKVRRAQARADVRRAMLAAALDVQTAGTDALKKHADPVAGGPFEYVAFNGGFELRSRFTHEDKPVTLSVGTRAK